MWPGCAHTGPHKHSRATLCPCLAQAPVLLLHSKGNRGWECPPGMAVSPWDRNVPLGWQCPSGTGQECPSGIGMSLWNGNVPLGWDRSVPLGWECPSETGQQCLSGMGQECPSGMGQKCPSEMGQECPPGMAVSLWDGNVWAVPGLLTKSGWAGNGPRLQRPEQRGSSWLKQFHLNQTELSNAHLGSAWGPAEHS